MYNNGLIKVIYSNVDVTTLTHFNVYMMISTIKTIYVEGKRNLIEPS